MDMVKEVFNDLYRLLNGTKAVGLINLMEKYKEEPLFGALMSNICLAAEIKVNDAMKEAYGIYKSFAQQELDEAGLSRLYEDACAFEAKWKNLWCSQLIVSIVAMLDPDRGEVSSFMEETGKKKGTEHQASVDMEEKQEDINLKQEALAA